MFLLKKLLPLHLKLISMKKIKFLFIAFLAIIVSSQMISCKKEDKATKDKGDLVGTWRSVSITGTTTIDGVVTMDNVTMPITTFEIIFNKDNTYTATNDEDSTDNHSGTYKINGTSIEVTNDKGVKQDLENYTVSKTEFTYSGTDSSDEDGKKEVTKYTLKFNRK